MADAWFPAVIRGVMGSGVEERLVAGSEALGRRTAIQVLDRLQGLTHTSQGPRAWRSSSPAGSRRPELG